MTLQAALKNSSRSSAPTVRFLAKLQPLQEPPNGRITEGLTREAFQEHPSLTNGGRGALIYILLEKLFFIFACFRRSAGRLLRLEGFSLLDDPSVALH